MNYLKRYDQILFIFSALNLLLWSVKAFFINKENAPEAIYELGALLFVPMILLLFLLPTLIVIRTFRKRVSITSYPFLSLLMCVITLAIIFYNN